MAAIEAFSMTLFAAEMNSSLLSLATVHTFKKSGITPKAAPDAGKEARDKCARCPQCPGEAGFLKFLSRRCRLMADSRNEEAGDRDLTT